MVREVHEARIPTERIKARSATTIPDVACGHKRVQEKYRRCAGAFSAGKKIRSRDVVSGELCLDWTAPCEGGATVPELFGKIDVVRSEVIFLRGEPFASSHVMLHILTAAPVQPVARLEEIHRGA